MPYSTEIRARDTRPRVLTLARNYPSDALPLLGLWTQRLVECAAEHNDVKVVTPVPMAPPGPFAKLLPQYARYTRLRHHRWDKGVEVFHPRQVVGPGYSLHNIESLLYGLAILPLVHRLRRNFEFDLIHAHFVYPDAVVAAVLASHYRVPFVFTDQAPWVPWMRQYPIVRKQALWAAERAAAHFVVSDSLRKTVAAITGHAERVRVMPNVVDGEVFRPLPEGRRIANQILFVGVVREVKGVDILLRAMPEVRRRHPSVRLVLAGDPFYASYRREGERLRTLADNLDISDSVHWVGGKTPGEVAALMATSSVVVLPSRRETFGAVLVEAMACGTPVVATKSGGPDEVVTPAVGRLVPTADPSALAAALVDVLDEPHVFDPVQLRRYALECFGKATVAQRLARAYAEALGKSSPSELSVGA